MGKPVDIARPRLGVTYIGHATLLLQLGNIRILTDPNFDSRLGIFLPRITAPGILIHELPKLDAILLTHAHADHLSFRSLRALPPNVPVYSPQIISSWLRRSGITSARSINPGTSDCVGDVSITAAAAKHIGSRYGIDRWRGNAHMYLVDDGISSILFAGDTALTPSIVSLAEQILPRRVDVVLLPIGHAPRWKRSAFRRGHLTAGDALFLFAQLNAHILVPFHWGTFSHVTSGPLDAIRTFRQLLQTYARALDVKILEPGQSFTLSELDE